MVVKNRHGRFELSNQSNIVIWQGFGSWNEETTQDLFESVNSLIKQFDGVGWAFVADAREWQLASPDTLQLWPPALKVMVDNGLVCGAIVMERNALKHNIIIKNLPKNGAEYQTFDNVEDALQWCQNTLD
ncbi:hypothetical protein L4C34_12265 [Vibrio profundum]|uniref:hypothetical protein n=1 Tax=Vibrio profundum TaxID=2910247 RepID=UPI003D095EC3